jgi:DNA-binding CsgD family transcriptional regulator
MTKENALLRNETVSRISAPDLMLIAQAPDWDQLRARSQSLLTQLGICDFMLKMDVSGVNGVALVQMLGTLPEATLQLFNQPTDDKSDPVQQHLARSCLPLNWQVEQLCLLHGGQIYPLLRTMGITHGMSLALHTKQSVNRIDFYSNTTLPASAQADALLHGLYLQEATELLWRKATPNQESLLSARELECLRWCADGKTSSEIGLILGISQRTVYFHMKNVATRLGVYSTRHAISRAVMIGLIKPNK